MRLEPAWGSKNWIGPLVGPKMPEWAKTAHRRMQDMKVDPVQIEVILREMRNGMRSKVYTLETVQGMAEYEVIFE